MPADNGLGRAVTQKQVTFNDTPEIAELNIDLCPQVDGSTTENPSLGAMSPSKLKKAVEKDRHSKTGRRGLPKKGMLSVMC